MKQIITKTNEIQNGPFRDVMAFSMADHMHYTYTINYVCTPDR